MKKVVFVLFIGVSQLFSYCTKVPCNSYIQQAQAQTQGKINRMYAELSAALVELNIKYSEYQEVLERQNKLLEDWKTLKAENTLLETEIVFLRNKDNEIVNLSIDGVTIRKEIQR